jgi:hypothetical protein
MSAGDAASRGAADNVIRIGEVGSMTAAPLEAASPALIWDFLQQPKEASSRERTARGARRVRRIIICPLP